MLIDEPYIEKRIEAAKDKAKKVMDGKAETLEEALYSLRFIIGREYNLPIFHEYFSKRTFDELVFEVELIKLSKMDRSEKISDTINSNKEEMGAIFDEWEKVDSEISDDQFLEDSKEFMNNGNFKEPSDVE